MACCPAITERFPHRRERFQTLVRICCADRDQLGISQTAIIDYARPASLCRGGVGEHKEPIMFTFRNGCGQIAIEIL